MGLLKKNELDFDAILSRVKKVLNTDNDKDVANAIGMKPNAFYNRKRSGSVPLSEFVCLANTFNVSMDWLINGYGQMFIGEFCEETADHSEPAPPQTMSKKENVIVIKHQDLVSQFDDPEKGIQNNIHLLGIERASKQLYNKVSDYLKTTHETAKLIKAEIEGQKKTNETGWKDSDGKNIDSA